MKRVLIGLALGAMALCSAQAVWAFGIQVDVPVAATLTSTPDNSAISKTTSSSGTTSGGMVGLNFGLLGIGYEDYSLSQKTNGQTSTFGVTMYDLALNLPIPVVNIAIGGGVGTGKLSGDAYSGITTHDADLTQYFVQLGWPIGLMFDIHVGYRQLNGTNSLDIPLVGTVKVKQDAKVTTLGLRWGY